MLDKDYNFKGHVEILYMTFIIYKILFTNNMAHQKIGLIEKISPIKLYTKVKKSIEKNTNIRYNLIDEN